MLRTVAALTGPALQLSLLKVDTGGQLLVLIRINMDRKGRCLHKKGKMNDLKNYILSSLVFLK